MSELVDLAELQGFLDYDPAEPMTPEVYRAKLYTAYRFLELQGEAPQPFEAFERSYRLGRDEAVADHAAE